MMLRAPVGNTTPRRGMERWSFEGRWGRDYELGNANTSRESRGGGILKRRVRRNGSEKYSLFREPEWDYQSNLGWREFPTTKSQQRLNDMKW